MAPHSSTFAWKIPWTEEPGRLQSMGSLESDTTERLHFHFSLSTFMHWRRKWQPTPVFLPGESQRRGALLGCRLWGRTESDTTEGLSSSSRYNIKQSFKPLKREWSLGRVRILCSHSPATWKRRRQWHPTPVLLPGKSRGQKSLVGCSPWGR